MRDPKIGDKVWELVEGPAYSWTLNQEVVYEIIEVKKADDIQHYCDKYVIKNESGEEKEVEEGYFVVCPEDGKDNSQTIHNYLESNGIYCEVYKESEEVVQAHIDWGDWKHDHLRCAWLMRWIGFDERDVIVTEENGSDCYSAAHYFYKKCEETA